jgi:hypothetical protein
MVHAVVFATAMQVLDGYQHRCVGVFGHDFLEVVEDRGEVVDAPWNSTLLRMRRDMTTLRA